MVNTGSWSVQTVDSIFLKYLVGKTLEKSASVHLLFAFEYVILASATVSTFLKYTLSMIDAWLEVSYLQLSGLTPLSGPTGPSLQQHGLMSCCGDLLPLISTHLEGPPVLALQRHWSRMAHVCRMRLYCSRGMRARRC
jgi:hypothetical protein